MGLVEPMFLIDILKGEMSLTLTGGYSTRVPGCVLLSMIGQISLLTACFLNSAIKFYLALAGIAVLYLAMLFLTVDFSSGRSDSFTLLFAIPFIYASIRLLAFLFKVRRKTLNENYSR